jgi:hypothetical protein
MKLTHPCKETCSGYSQDCAEQVASLQARVKALEQQHHECGQSELKHDIRADELAIENAKLESRIKDLREMHSHVCDLLAAECEERNRLRKGVEAIAELLPKPLGSTRIGELILELGN